MSIDEIDVKDTGDILRLIRNIYHTIVRVNLTTNNHRCIQTNRELVRKNFEQLPSLRDWTKFCIREGLVYADDVDEFRGFLEQDRIRQALNQGKEYMSLAFRRIFFGNYRWEMMEIIAGQDYRDDNQVIILCIRDIDEERQRELDKEAKLSAQERQLVGEKTVLVVDDAEIQRNTLCYFLEQGYRTVEAENGLVAYNYLKENVTEVNLVLLDLNMPVMDGYQFLAKIQQDEIMKSIPVLVLTGDNNPEEEAGCLQAGAVDFVAKPFNPKVLLSRIERAIALHETTVMLNSLRKDDLTNCYAKDYFLHMAEQMLVKYPDEEYDLICTQVMNFATISEQYGSRQAQGILTYVAHQHEAEEAERSVYGRYGEDIFVRLLPHSCKVYERVLLHQKSREGNFSDYHPGLPPFTLKFGLYENVDRSLSVRAMCERAILPLHQIRHAYGKEIARYRDSLRDNAIKVQRVLDGMENAIEEKQFQVWYQPKHDIATGKLVGAEALVRWMHPRHGFMSPGEFIPIFEENGFVAKMDYYVWEESCAAVKRWREKGLVTVPISVNISRADFIYFRGQDVLQPLVEKYGLQPSDLHLEVTESAYVDHQEMVISQVNSLHKRGFPIELDDFGTGYSSLSMFSHMNIDVVKLDMSFIRQARSEQNDKMLQHIITMCKAMGLQVLSEGVETEEQLQRLLSMGCDYVQGYYYSKPLPEAEFEAYLQNNKC